MKKRLCIEAGCRNFVDPPYHYCERHRKNAGKKTSVPFAAAIRSNSSMYNTQKWRLLRNRHLKQEPYCVICGATDSLQADHIQPPQGDEGVFFDPGNLQTLCVTCHRRKTQMEIDARKAWRRGNRMNR
jgi:5-methylcytosine-specific restriction protein A